MWQKARAWFADQTPANRFDLICVFGWVLIVLGFEVLAYCLCPPGEYTNKAIVAALAGGLVGAVLWLAAIILLLLSHSQWFKK